MSCINADIDVPGLSEVFGASFSQEASIVHDVSFSFGGSSSTFSQDPSQALPQVASSPAAAMVPEPGGRSVAVERTRDWITFSTFTLGSLLQKV
jgi:hypothetical protein